MIEHSTKHDLPDIPAGIDIPMIQLIHRGKDGWIPFMKRRADGEGLEPLFSIQQQMLKSYFPEMLEWLKEDAYMGVNSCYSAAPWVNKKTGLPSAWRGKNRTRYLNACYVDLDVGRPNSDIEVQRYSYLDAKYMAEKMMENGEIPEASIIARSGRGVYLLWLIRSKKDPDQPQRAYKPEHSNKISSEVMIYERINKALNAKLQGLAADDKATDAARVLKVPGTIDSKSKNPVGFWIRVSLKDHSIYTYTLEQLAAELNIIDKGKVIDALPVHSDGCSISLLPLKDPYGDKIRKVHKRGSKPQNRIGWIVRNTNRVKDLNKIEAWLGGFRQGQRRFSLKFYAECMKHCERDEAEIRAVLESMAARCNPPYPSDLNDASLSSIIHDVMFNDAKLSKFGNEKICKIFSITKEIACELGLASIIPPDLKAEWEAEEKARKQREQAERERERVAYKKAEQAAVERLIYGSGKGYPLRDLTEIMCENGFPMSHETFRKIKIEIEAKHEHHKPQSKQG